MGINQISPAVAARILQQQADDVQKHQGHGGGHRGGSEKFAEIAQAAAGMKPSAVQTARTREASKGKDAPRKEKRSHDREDDAAEDQPPPRNSRNVDVSV